MDIDVDAEKRRVKWMMRVGIIFFASACFSWSEMKYRLFAKTTDATVIATREHRSTTGIDYRFKDLKGTLREETDQVSSNEEVPVRGSKIKIEFLDHKDSSRIAGNSSMAFVYIFLACSAVFGIMLLNLLREAYFPK